MASPRLTNAELRYLRQLLWPKQEGCYDVETGRWVYPTELSRKLSRILAARKKAPK